MCIKRNETIEYYDKYAKEYFEKSVAVDMSDLCDKFLKYVPKGSTILDIGCGSGRDLKYFREHGYMAEGLEPSVELKRLAEEYSGCKVHLSTIQDFNPTAKYDALWVCASVLHLNHDEQISFFAGIDKFLNSRGVVCISMKSGIKTGKDELGRYFENFNEERLRSILKSNNRIKVINQWMSHDIMNRNDTIWINILMKYEK